MSDQFLRKVADMISLALVGDIEPDHIFPVILCAWEREEIKHQELKDLYGQTTVVVEIVHEVRGLGNRLKGKEPLHRQVLKSAVQELIDKTLDQFGGTNAQILKGRIKRDLSLTDEFEKQP